MTAWPSTITVQAPQSPTSQPSLAPVKWNWSRSKRSSVVSGGTEALRVWPLTVIVTSVTLRAPFRSPRARQRIAERPFHQHRDEIAPIVRAGAEIADRLASVAAMRPASAIASALIVRPSRQASAFGARITTGATAPSAMRGLRKFPFRSAETRRDIDQRQGLALAQTEFLERGGLPRFSLGMTMSTSRSPGLRLVLRGPTNSSASGIRRLPAASPP